MGFRLAALAFALACPPHAFSVEAPAAQAAGATSPAAPSVKPAGPVADLSGHDWPEAFEILHATLKLRYAFGEWKQIDWELLRLRALAGIMRARLAKDRRAYYLALREYVFSIPDGHMEFSGENEGLSDEFIGGSFGLNLMQLDDGRVIAHQVYGGHGASKAGMKPFAELVTWNGEPIQQALEKTSLLWAVHPPATSEMRRLQRLRMLVRGRVGTTVEASFRNPHSDQLVTARLKAGDDNLRHHTSTDFSVESDYEVPVRSSILKNGVGVIKITRFDAGGPDESDTEAELRIYKSFLTAIQTFNKKGVNKVVLDLRRNKGGIVRLAARMAGVFHTEKTPYCYAAYYEDDVQRFKIGTMIDIEPGAIRFSGPVAVLVGPATLSSGEGMAHAIQRLPQGKVFGFFGTQGSCGVAGGRVLMPGDIRISYPFGRNCDPQGRIQIDANAAGEGGVVPDIRLPLNEQTVQDAFVKKKDLEMDAAVNWLLAQ